NILNTPNIAKNNKEIGYRLYQGDIILNIKQAEYLHSKLFFILTKRIRRQAINSITFPTSLWQNRKVPYTFGNSLTEDRKQRIREALKFWSEQTCLNFIEEQLYQNYVGKQEGDQYVSIGEDCDQFGIITHEIAHALGFFHEQSRWDRDKFVKVSLNSIKAGYEDQFDKETEEENDNQQVEYDLGSVMHYSEFAFSSPEAHNPVLTAKEPFNQKTMGQRIAPSFLDVLLMNKRYMCLGYDCRASNTICKNGGFPKPKDCSQCICPWGFGGKLCDERKESFGKQAKCGETIQSLSEWNELTGTIGNDNIDQSEFNYCHWHLQAPKGKLIELEITKIGTDSSCHEACFYGNVEFKVKADFTKTGIRMCCQSDLPSEGLKLLSETNLVVLSLYSRKGVQTFSLRHRIIKN
ncbi:Metalloendopeptidase, partial [Meloidogyne graminicola]